MATPMATRRPASDAGQGYRRVATGSAPSTPMGRRHVAASSFTPRSARSSRNSSRNGNLGSLQRPTLPSRSRIAPPRRMSTRLQLTLRGRLTERRRLSALTAAEADAQSSVNQPGGDDKDEDEDEDDEWSDSDDDSEDDEDEAGKGASATGESSSQTTGGNLNGDSKDKHAERTRRERRRLRRQRRLLWSLVDAIRVVYYLISLPVRVGLFWNPFSTAGHNAWTHALTVFISLDAVADAYGIMRRWMEHVRRRNRVEARKRADAALQVEGAEAVDDQDAAVAVPRVLYGTMVMDVIALTPVEIVLLACGQNNALHIARLTKLFALRQLPSQSLAFILRSHSRRFLWPLHRVLGRFLTVLVVIGAVWVHWSANIYVLIAHIECGLSLDKRADCASWAIDDQNRPVASGGGGGSHWRIYSRAAYWASRTIITLGFSDVVANSSRWGETFFTIIAEFAGAFWCACVIAGFAYWFTLQHRRGSKYSHDMFVHRVEHLLGRPHFGLSKSDEADDSQGSAVPSFLRRRIVEFLKHEWTVSRSFHDPQCRRVVRQEQLQQSLQCELKTAKLLRLPCFSRQSIGFLNALAGEMKILSLAPLDWVVEYPGTQSVFFVVLSGSVAVVSPAHQEEKIYTCNPGDSFGVITLFNPGMLKEKAFAEEFSEILLLDADGLERVLRSYYHDRPLTAKQQRDEMHHAAQDDYTTFSERCRRRHDRQSIAVTKTTIPHRDAVQLAIEMAPSAWQHVESSFRVRWEVVRCLALLYLTFEVPYIVVFYYGSTRSSYFGDDNDWRFSVTFACSAVVEIFFYLDLYLRCREFEPRKKVNSLTFYLDAAANMPLALLVDIYDGCTHGALPGGWRWLSLLRLIRLLRVRQLKKRVASTLPRATGVAQFIIYCALAILVYCHVVACVWFLSGHYSLDTDAFSLENVASSLPSKSDCLRLAQQYSNCSWTLMDGMEATYEDGDRRFVFLRSMYFSVSTFTTVAYGDILPYSTGETWVAGIATYIGGILCYVMFGAMGAAIERLSRRRRETRYENHLRARVLELNKISRKLRSEINRFQAFRAKTLADHDLEEELIAYLSPGLRAELNTCLYRSDAEKFAFLQGASPSFRDAVAAHMTRRFYFKGDTIFSAGSSATEMMVIRHGHVHLVDGDSQIVVTVLVNGATLGELSCVSPSEPLLVDYVAESVTEVAVISREALEELWKHFPAEKERMESNVSEGGRLQQASPQTVDEANDTSNALSRIHIRQDSLGKATIEEFNERVKWQRAINGNTFRSKWEVLIGTVVVYNTFSIIARVAFSPSPSKRVMVTLTTIDYVFDLALLIDIYLKSFHFLAPADLLSVSSQIFSPRQIRAYYFRDGWMVWDLLASLPLYYIGSNYATMTYCRIPRILRALQLVEIGERVHSGLLQRLTVSTSSAGVAYSLLGLGKVLMVLLLCCHIGGSAFYAISSHEAADSGRTPWVSGDVVILQHAGNLSVAYLRSFYWAISTFTVVNYGDIVATTVRETLWACLICLTGTFFMSKVIGDIVDLLQSLDRCASEHRERVEQFEYVAQRRDFPDELTERGQTYLVYEYEVTHGLPAPETLFCSLPFELQTQVYDEMYGSILRRVPLFESLTDGQIRELAAAPWRTELFTPDDIIVYENSLADALFVMKEGRAQIHRFSSGLSITQIGSGELFGEAMFFTPEENLSGETSGPRRMVSVQALTFCEVLRLDREAWLRFMAMRASNREAGRRVLEIAQGEQLKSRAVLQRLGSYLDPHHAHDESKDRPISNSSSHSAEEELDEFDGDAQATTYSRAMYRDVRVGSPDEHQQNGVPRPTARRFGSSPALLISQIARQLSFPKNSRRTSDGYVAASTPVVPALQMEPRRAVSTLNIFKRFGSPRESHPDDYERRDGEATQEATQSQPVPQRIRFLDSSPFCYRWDAVKFFAIVYYVAALPLRVSFYDAIERAAESSSGDGDRAMTIWIVLEYVFVDGFLWIDILMRLFVFTPTVRGEPLTTGRQRREWYVRHGSFVIDLLGSFPFELLSLLPFDSFHRGAERGQIVAAAIRLTTLVRCFQLEPLWWRLERQLFWFEKDTLTTLKIAFVGVLSSHWIACLWYFVGHASMPSNPLSWLTAPNMLAPDPTGTGAPLTEDQVNSVSMLNKYLRSYHYAIGSISTTTYGDIVSRNVAETLVQLVITFLCIVFYGYVTTGVRQILSRKFARTIALEQDEAKIRGFARHYGLSRSLVAAIRAHLRERWRQESDVDQRAVADLVHAPLRRDIAAYLRNALLETEEPKTKVFEKLPEVMVTTLLSEMREEAYGEDEIIYEQYAVGRVMYFVESGSVLLTTEQRDLPTDKCVKTQGDYFGESCVVDRATYGSERRATAVAQTDCRLVVLDVDTFERVLQAFPTHAATLRAAWSPPVKSYAV